LWYYPTETKNWYVWEGGIIGSASVNDAYVEGDAARLAVFIDVTGHLLVVYHNQIDPNKFALGPDAKTLYPMPKVLIDYKLEGTISTPIIVNDKIIAPTDKGLFLFKIDIQNEKLILLDVLKDIDFDAAPIAVDGKIYIAGRDGFLYCLGK
jgi:outer membrane protein assembly factor BamB